MHPKVCLCRIIRGPDFSRQAAKPSIAALLVGRSHVECAAAIEPAYGALAERRLKRALELAPNL